MSIGHVEACKRMRQILVPLSGQFDRDDPEALDVPALKTAFTLARSFDAHVEVFCMEAEIDRAHRHLSTWVPGATVSEIIDSIEAESEKRRERARAAFEQIAALSGVPRGLAPGAGAGYSADFIEHTGDIRGALSFRGRLADIIVTANAPGRFPEGHPLILEVALRETGRPVLVSPFEPRETIGRRVVVAWNGSAEASRAVAISMELLTGAESVRVISVREDGPPGPDADDLADYLRWHGIEAKTKTFDGDAASAGQIVLAEAVAEKADLLVMGAYTRDRVSRLIFGGVTRDVLTHGTIPVLMLD